MTQVDRNGRSRRHCARQLKYLLKLSYNVLARRNAWVRLDSPVVSNLLGGHAFMTCAVNFGFKHWCVLSEVVRN